MTAETRPIEILLVEHDPGDVRLTLEALADSRLRNTIHVAPDGAAALAFLYRRGEYGAAPRSDLILLNLGLPKKGSLAALAAVRAIPPLQDVPVLADCFGPGADIAQCHQLRVDGYLVKPVNLKQLLDLVQLFGDFWLEVLTTPRESGNGTDR